MCAEPRIVFLHPPPINLAANGKSPGLGPMMISSLYFPILVPVGVFLGHLHGLVMGGGRELI